GNVRELGNVIERGAILARGEEITPVDLPFKNQPAAQPVTEASGGSSALRLRDAERVQVGRALRQTGWNKSQAAGLLGVTRKTLDRKIKEFAITAEDLLPPP
ncbi:MAG: helix-turn-helix domain-containing protein, partial [Brevundimonas sp.]|nr:helix-turn-helix domain-containing protein [Brevundimonas sp.]